MGFLYGVYKFLDKHVNWDFGPAVNAELSKIWQGIEKWIIWEWIF